MADTHTTHLSASNPSGGNTLLYYSFASFGNIGNIRLEPGSTDTSGSVLGTLSGAGTFEVVIRFSESFTIAPKAVVLQAPTPSSGVPSSGYLLTVENITASGFEVIGQTPSAEPDGVLFYYIVL